MPGPLIERGDRVTLRTLENEDLPFVQRAYTNPSVRYPMGCPLKTQEQLEEWLEGGGADRLLVCLDSDSAPDGHPCSDDVQPIGVVNVEDADWKRPELTYWLVPEVHGEGYGSEAVSLAIDYTFRTYNAPVISAGAYDFNDASRGLLESLGFSEEGRLRKYMFVNGRHCDLLSYGLLREEWEDRA